MKAYISEIAGFVSRDVEIRGWLYNKRSSGKLYFLLVRDGTGTIQVIADKASVGDEMFARCEELTQESSLIAKGTVREERRAPGGYEMVLSELQIVHLSSDYPLTPKEHGVSFLLDRRHLWLRSSRQHAVLSVRSCVEKACRDFLDSRGFMLIDAPILTPAACEGTTTLFQTDYFGSLAYLSQSGQLYMEAAAMAFGKVYCLGPTFRAERSKTRRHLIEFWMLEPEVAFATLDDVTTLGEELVAFVVRSVLEQRRDALETLGRSLEALEQIEIPFPRVTYGDAVDVLKSKGLDIKWGDDFGAVEEAELSKSYDRPVFVRYFPSECKAFYMKSSPDDPRTTLSVDLLAPEGYGEIIGGGQREDSLEVLEEKVKKAGLPREAFEWYLDLRRYGSVEHSGFGLGLERTVAWICGIEHVREAIPFPRMLHRLGP
ncbi:MAG: asparagine--tRNA ligase [Candidatus Eiseniibacteriota bacterium]|nr:MAG: asparagine--tRNA ligase [Candidatus Eisenbacteria bacterium]